MIITKDQKLSILSYHLVSQRKVHPSVYVLMYMDLTDSISVSSGIVSKVFGKDCRSQLVKLYNSGHLRRFGKEYAITAKGRRKMKDYYERWENQINDIKNSIKYEANS